MKWFRVGFIVLLLVVGVGKVIAAPPPGAPTDFTLTKNGDDVDITWVMGAGANTTIIVRGANYYPEDRTDGVEVFSGVGVSFTDNTTNLDDNEYYYRAWGYDDVEYSVDYAEAFIGGMGMLAIAIALIVLFFTGLAFWKKEPMLFALGIIAWLFGAFFFYNMDYPEGNAYLPTAVLALGLSVVLIMAIFMYTSTIRMRDEKNARKPKVLTYEERKARNLEKTKRITTIRRRSPWDD